MVVYHLANSEYSHVKLTTWRVLNMTVSIFAAVLLYGTIHHILEHVLQPSPAARVTITLLLFLFLFVGSHALLFKLKGGDGLRLQAAATILSHIVGFSAMYGFADSQEEIELFAENGVSGMMAMVLAGSVIIGGLGFVLSRVMIKFAESDGSVSESEKQWIDVCEESDEDVFCLATSFLLVLLFRHAIRGKAQPYEPGRIVDVTQRDANLLLACSFGSGVLTAFGTLVLKMLHHSVPYHSPARRIATISQHLCSMTTAWAFVFWAEWQLYVWGWEHTVIGGCLAIAVFMTLFSFVCILFIQILRSQSHENKALRRAVSSMELALGVLIGFCWERAFDVAFEELESDLFHSVHRESFEHTAMSLIVVSLMNLGLFAIVASAWRRYILPKAEHLEATKKAEKSRAANQ
jgi:uncharacterized membrane protein